MAIFWLTRSEVSWNYLVCRNRRFHYEDRTLVCAKGWHRAGGLRLKPGDGPVKVDLTVTCKRVKE